MCDRYWPDIIQSISLYLTHTNTHMHTETESDRDKNEHLQYNNEGRTKGENLVRILLHTKKCEHLFVKNHRIVNKRNNRESVLNFRFGKLFQNV